MTRNKIISLSLLFLFALLFSCREDINIVDTDKKIDPPEIIVNASVSGIIQDESDLPVASAQIVIGSVITESDENGYFKLEDIQMNQYGTYIKVIKEGYFDAGKFVQPHLNQESYLEIILIAKEMTGNFASGSGGKLSTNGGAAIDFPANGVVDANGQAYNGTVNVFAKWLDPTLSTLEEIMPGDLRAIDSDDEFVQLATFGMIGVELESPSGQSLQLASGSTAQIELPIPASLMSNAPASIPLWHFDKDSGYWVEEGTAQRQGDKYIGTVSHFSFWNCDAPFPLVEMTGSVVNENGEGLANLCVRIEINSSNSAGYGWTNEEGQFSGKIPKNEELTLVIKNSCGEEIFSQTIGPFSENVTLDPIVLEPTENTVNITGSIENCDSEVVTNGYVKVTFGNQVKVINANEDGTFSGTIIICDATEIQVVGVDFENQLQSEPQTYDVTGGADLDTGILTACDELEEFFYYSLNGGDNIYTVEAFAQTMDSTQQDEVLFISGIIENQGTTGIPTISIDADSPGTYNPLYIVLFDPGDPNNVVICEICEDLDVTITEFGDVGELIRGTFTGQADGNGGPPVDVEGAFKIFIDN